MAYKTVFQEMSTLNAPASFSDAWAEILAGCQHPASLVNRDWRGALSSLPLMTDDYVFTRNWMASAEQLARDCETNAARYQLTQVQRRLIQALKAWNLSEIVESADAPELSSLC